MARAPDMEGQPSTDLDAILKQATRYRELEDELKTKRQATKDTTSGKTAWRKECAAANINPVILADAIDLMRKVEAYPKRTTRGMADVCRLSQRLRVLRQA